METGIVKFFNPKKGYGFIATSDPDRDVFLHKTGIPFGILVNTGDMVAFETVQGPKGPNAKIVRVIDGVSSRQLDHIRLKSSRKNLVSYFFVFLK